MFSNPMKRWLEKMFRIPAPTPSSRRQRGLPASRRFVPRLEALETRLTPSTYTVTDTSDSYTNPDTGSLRYAVNTINNNLVSSLNNTINFNLPSGSVITLSAPLRLFGYTTINGPVGG